VLFLLAIQPLLATPLVRVDVADHPEAIATSRYGSTLLAPPTDGTAWRAAPVPEITAVNHDGWTAIEAIDSMGVESWHDYGLDGSGVRIAIFDIQWFQLEQHPTLGALPSHDCFGHRSCELPIDTLHPQFAFETGGHGIACAEVIQAIAPGADIQLVRVNGLTALENATEWAIRENIDVISMSMSFFSESFYDGTGSINRAVDKLVDAGILLVNSAGNYAQQHSKGWFEDPNGNGHNDFPWDSEYLPIYLPDGETKISLTWDDYRRCGSTDFDAYIYDEEGYLRDRSTRVQEAGDDNCTPVETLKVNASEDGWHYLLIYKRAGKGNVQYKVMTRKGRVFEPVTEGSVTDPGSHPHVFTVGAVYENGYRLNDVESFSSQGPTESGAQKPDISGPDGLTTSVYGERGFFGTSAATPAVAGAIALIMSKDPQLTPRDAALHLQASAISMGPAWSPPDPALGAGKAYLPSLQESHTGCGQGTPLLIVLFWIPMAAIRRRN